MSGLRDTFENIRHALPKAEKAWVKIFFQQLAELCEPEDQRNLRQRTAGISSNILLWNSVDSILQDLNANSPELILGESASSDEIYEIIKDFSKYAQSRRKKMEQISWMASTHRVEKLCFCLSKSSLRETAYFLHDLWVKFKERNFPDWSVSDKDLRIDFKDINVGAILSNIENISNIFDMLEIKNSKNDNYPINIKFLDRVHPIHINAMRHKLEALRIMALLIHEDQTRIKGISGIEIFPLHDFEHCPLCWRLVPKNKRNSMKKNENGKKYSKIKRYPYCDIHNYQDQTKTQYYKAHNLPYQKNRSNHFLPERTLKILKQFPSIAPEHEEGLSAQEWFEARRSPMAAINLEKFPKIEFDLAFIWDICPNVLKYIEEHDGDPNSPESVLEILDPFTRSEEQNGKEARMTLHKLFTKNFALYFPELAVAETFLSEYNAQWSGRTHGGKRPNSGGARPGTGRKPRHQREAKFLP